MEETAITIQPILLDQNPLKMKLSEIAVVKINLRIPHGTGSYVRMDFIPSKISIKLIDSNCTPNILASGLKICKVTISHIGSNYPCMNDPSKGFQGRMATNTTRITYKDAWRRSGYSVQFLSRYLANYG